ncbi:MAG: type II toxin-antitoxin system VapC family toxin [Hyphomicrobiaceae bacterium]
MIAIDTNVLIRIVVDDHREQVARAARLIAKEDVFVSTTVLLEAEWVLRGLYGLPSATVAASLESFCGLDNVLVEGGAVLHRVLAAYRSGADFADALHLSSCEMNTIATFATFDEKLRKRLRDFSDTIVLIAP